MKKGPQGKTPHGPALLNYKLFVFQLYFMVGLAVVAVQCTNLTFPHIVSTATIVAMLFVTRLSVHLIPNEPTQ